ncbi:hypothetical protein MLD63_03670 [Paracoccus sp. TK19116]|uniref:Uncharacterized protein n=1 Tax=Paracoccus albicereus TaxID=2922394 RepID=A0ABT1MN50_9RHOB|nr:hypothetical protein [Paracoccus albicereus]MCQ0969534.1 hypothetical protein [Paracoccus albicereus]
MAEKHDGELEQIISLLVGICLKVIGTERLIEELRLQRGKAGDDTPVHDIMIKAIEEDFARKNFGRGENILLFPR